LLKYRSLGRNKCYSYYVLLAVFNHFWAKKWNLTPPELFFSLEDCPKKIQLKIPILGKNEVSAT